MPIYKGSTEVTAGNLKLGSKDVKEVYLGSEKIWPSAAPFTYEFLANKNKDAALGDATGSRIPQTREEMISSKHSSEYLSSEQFNDLLRANKEWRTIEVNLGAASSDDLLIVMCSHEEIGDYPPAEYSQSTYSKYSNPIINFAIKKSNGQKTVYNPTASESYLEYPDRLETNANYVVAYQGTGIRAFLLAIPVADYAGDSAVKIRWDAVQDWNGSDDFIGYEWRRHQLSAFLVHSGADAKMEHSKGFHVSWDNEDLCEVKTSFSGVTENDLIFTVPMYGMSYPYNDGTLQPKCTYSVSNGRTDIVEGLGNQRELGGSWTANYGSSDHLVLSEFTSSNVDIVYGTNKPPNRSASMCSLRIYR